MRYLSEISEGDILVSEISEGDINIACSSWPLVTELLIGRALARSLWSVGGPARSRLSHDVADDPSANIDSVR